MSTRMYTRRHTLTSNEGKNYLIYKEKVIQISVKDVLELSTIIYDTHNN